MFDILLLVFDVEIELARIQGMYASVASRSPFADDERVVGVAAVLVLDRKSVV